MSSVSLSGEHRSNAAISYRCKSRIIPWRRLRERRGSRRQKPICQPVPHGGGAERQVIALAVLSTAFIAGEDAQRLIRRAARRIKRLGILERHLLVVLAVHDEERAAHLLHNAVEPER